MRNLIYFTTIGIMPKMFKNIVSPVETRGRASLRRRAKRGAYIMYNTTRVVQMAMFRSRAVAWLLLIMFISASLPTISVAQQPTATIRAMNGTVFISGRTASVGAVIGAGDTIQTQTGAGVTLALSDGSTVRLGENTDVALSVLTQSADGARTSWLSLARGRLRALLSPGHQAAGSAFTVGTPNAQVGVKFSQPDFEVSYDPAKQETVGIAHSVELTAINLLTNEVITVPVGSTVVIVGLLMKIAAGTAASVIPLEAVTGAAATATGLGAGTMVAIGVGAAAAVGGVVAVAANSGDDNGNDNNDTGDNNGNDGTNVNNPFTGTFSNEFSGPVVPDNECFLPEGSMRRTTVVITLTQNGTALTGTFAADREYVNCCTASDTLSFRGTVDGNTATIPFFSELVLSCRGNDCGCTETGGGAGANFTLEDDGRKLRLGDEEYYRQ